MAPQIEDDAAWVDHDTGIDSLGAGYRRQRRIIVVSAIAFAVFVIAATGILSWQARERSLDMSQTELRNLSVALSELMARSLDSVDILLRSVAETAATGDLDDPGFAQRLHDAMRERALGAPSMRALVVINAASSSACRQSIASTTSGRSISLAASPSPTAASPAPRSRRSNRSITSGSTRRSTSAPAGPIAMFRSDGVLLARHPHAEAMTGKSVGDTPFRRFLR